MLKLFKSLGLASAISMSLSSSVTAHMQMIWPIPFNSIEDPSYYGNKVDYSMTNPLLTDGSNYPCKGYQTEGLDKIQATYTPGKTYNLTLAGSATHDGGSCQISLSYDNGKSFHVIKSMIGGCPLTPTWEFEIPASASSSNFTLLAWTWFNLIGNREMYMNCARVAIQPAPSSRRLIRGKIKREDQNVIPLVNLPNNFACNIGNGCQTIEEHEVVFPNPGPVVQLGQDDISASAGPGYTITGSTPTGNAFSSPKSAATSRTKVTSASHTATRKTTAISTSAPRKSSKAQTTLVHMTSSTSTGSVTNAVSVTESTTKTTTKPTTLIKSTMAASNGSGCTPGAIRCDSSTTWSMCVPTASGGGTWTFMGSVAAGTTCSHGVIGRSAEGDQR